MNSARATSLLLIVLVVSITLLQACRADIPDQAADRAAPSAEAAVGNTIALTGCIRSAPGEQFVLERIRIESASEELRRRARRAGITEWAWVRLDPGRYDLRRYLGHRVDVVGVVTASGHNTIGTAGTWGYRTPSGDKSQAASDEHYAKKQQLEAGRIARESLANGIPAAITIQRVGSTGSKCLDPEDSAP